MAMTEVVVMRLFFFLGTMSETLIKNDDNTAVAVEYAEAVVS